LLLSSQTSREYRAKWQEERDVSRVPEDEPAVFLEVSVADASEFEADLEIRREERFGYKVLTVSSAAVPRGPAGPEPANDKGVISRAAPRSPQWPGRVPRAW
jgi:hypothetical protein